MIKVGQIRKPKKEYWKTTYDSELKIVISKIEEDDYCDIIYEDGGVCNSAPIVFVEDKTELVAEYPTWQEAVNSKEFKGE